MVLAILGYAGVAERIGIILGKLLRPASINKMQNVWVSSASALAPKGSVKNLSHLCAVSFHG